VKELYNKVGDGAGFTSGGGTPEMNIQVDFDDDFNPEGTLASFKFKGRIHSHNLLNIVNSPSSDVPGINVFHLQIAPTLNNKKDRPVTMRN
jgi:hypothetical protein